MNIFELPFPLPEQESTEVLWKEKAVRVERIVSSGQTTGWYDQNQAEWLVLLQGNAEIEYETGEKTLLETGDTLLLAPHRRHRVSYTSAQPPCIWICIFANL